MAAERPSPCVCTSFKLMVTVLEFGSALLFPASGSLVNLTSPPSALALAICAWS